MAYGLCLQRRCGGPSSLACSRTPPSPDRRKQFYGQLEAGYSVELGGAASFRDAAGFDGDPNAFTETGAQSLNLSLAQPPSRCARCSAPNLMPWISVCDKLGTQLNWAGAMSTPTGTSGGLVHRRARGAVHGVWRTSARRRGRGLHQYRHYRTMGVTCATRHHRWPVSSHALTPGLRMSW
jgi:hypothetical protein